ncbi:MAG: M20/M25/M40 family metallo-hydrolase [Gemmatimonadota bacterium]
MSAQVPSKVEQQLAAHIDAHLADGTALLERAVNINSGTMHFEGVKKVADLFRAEYEALGFTVRWVDGAPFQRAGHLIAEHGTKGPKVLLIGHMDTVFEEDSPFQSFKWVGDTAAAGPGVTDMKGGDVIMIQALKALKAAGLLDRLRVTVVLTGDEENTGEPQAVARQALRDAAHGADYALGFEDADGDPRHIVIGRRGTVAWMLKVHGMPAHSSQIFRPENGPGAIYETARILNEFRLKLGGDPLVTFNPGAIVGGTTVTYDVAQSRGTAFGKDNVIAGQVIVTGDLRTISTEAREKAKNTMRQIVADSMPHTGAEISFEDGYPPMAPTDGNRKLLAMIDQVSQSLGQGPVTEVDPSRAGAADVSFVADLVPAVIDGLGLKGSGGHTVLEIADMRTFPVQIKRTALLLARLAK